MENEDNLYDRLVNRYGVQAGIVPPDPDFNGHPDNKEPDFNGHPDNKEIVIPSTFKDVVVKMFPEIQDIVSAGYRENVMYNVETFDPIKKYLVGIDLYFDDRYGMKKSKNNYGKELTDYFKMTYSELDFVTFHVRSFIFPPEKSNEDKFFELFGIV